MRFFKPLPSLTVSEAHKPKSTVTLRLLVHQHHSLLDLSKLAEVSLHLINGCILRHAANENLLRLVGRLRAVLWRCVLRVDFLSIQCVNRNFEDFLDGIRFLIYIDKLVS
jgi:hypothetical protein